MRFCLESQREYSSFSPFFFPSFFLLSDLILTFLVSQTIWKLPRPMESLLGLDWWTMADGSFLGQGMYIHPSITPVPTPNLIIVCRPLRLHWNHGWRSRKHLHRRHEHVGPPRFHLRSLGLQDHLRTPRRFVRSPRWFGMGSRNILCRRWIPTAFEEGIGVGDGAG